MKEMEEKFDIVKQVSCREKMTVNELIQEMNASGVMGAGKLARAVSIYEAMIRDRECKKFFGLAGAMVPGGMKNVVIDLMEKHWIDVLVTTGANLTHDLIEALGFHHFQGTHCVDDRILHKKGIDRMYDSYMKGDVYEKLEEFCLKAFKEMPRKMTIREFLWELGKRTPASHTRSILHTAYKEKIPIFCPAISDSGIGLMVWNEKIAKKGEAGIEVDAFDDLKEIMNLSWGEKGKQKLGSVIIGGGTPKNFIVQSFQFSPNKASYAIQITMDRPEHGGSSGAEPREAISWGKLHEKANYVNVICDATIALPIICAALKERIK